MTFHSIPVLTVAAIVLGIIALGGAVHDYVHPPKPAEAIVEPKQP